MPEEKEEKSAVVKTLSGLEIIYMILSFVGGIALIIVSVPKYGDPDTYGIILGIGIILSAIFVSTLIRGFAAAVDALQKIEKNTRTKGG